MDDRINTLKAFELNQSKQKTEELKRESDEKLKYSKDIKMVSMISNI